MNLYTLFLHPGPLGQAFLDARVAPHRLHVVAKDETKARRVAAEEAFAEHLAKKPGLANPWYDPARTGCAIFHPPAGLSFAGDERRVGPFGPLERHPGVPELMPEMRLLKARSHAERIEERPVPDDELIAHLWDLKAADGSRAVAWKRVPIFAAHVVPDGLELFRFPCEDVMLRLS